MSSSGFIVFGNAITFHYSSLLKGYTMDMVCPSVDGGSTTGFDADGMSLPGVGVQLGLH